MDYLQAPERAGETTKNRRGVSVSGEGGGPPTSVSAYDYQVSLRQRPSTGYYILTQGWKVNFVQRLNLKVDDLIFLGLNVQNMCVF